MYLGEEIERLPDKDPITKKRIVTFTYHPDVKPKDQTSPLLLHIHARMCEVKHLKGAAEVFEGPARGYEEETRVGGQYLLDRVSERLKEWVGKVESEGTCDE